MTELPDSFEIHYGSTIYPEMEEYVKMKLVVEFVYGLIQRLQDNMWLDETNVVGRFVENYIEEKLP